MSADDARARGDRYDQLLRLADLLDASGQALRDQSSRAERLLSEPEMSESAALSPLTYEAAEEALRDATSGKHGALTRSVELDADALVLRATVLTYRWIDDLQQAAYSTLGSIAGRAIGFLAPEVELGGAIVSAGLIETDALDRDGVVAYLNELAENNPELLDHVSSGGGGIVDSLQMRSLLTVGFLAGSRGAAAARGGLRAIGVTPLAPHGLDALRDVAGDFMNSPPETPGHPTIHGDYAVPSSLEGIVATLADTTAPVTMVAVGGDRFIVYLTGSADPAGSAVSTVNDGEYVDLIVRTIQAAAADSTDPRVLLVGSARGGAAAVELAARRLPTTFTVEQIVTAGAPSSHVHVVPSEIPVLSLEDRSDPVALLGSLISHGQPNRVTVLFQGDGRGMSAYVAGARAVDDTVQPELAEVLTRLTRWGYLTSR